MVKYFSAKQMDPTNIYLGVIKCSTMEIHQVVALASGDGIIDVGLSADY